MNHAIRLILAFAALAFAAQPALAHHLMGGKMPTTFGEGILSGLGHPIIGIDHFAAIVAVGCLAAAHRAAPALAIAFVVAMMCASRFTCRRSRCPRLSFSSRPRSSLSAQS